MKQLFGVINPLTYKGKLNNKMSSTNVRYFQKGSKGQCILAQIASSHYKVSVKSSMNKNLQTYSWRMVLGKVQRDKCPRPKLLCKDVETDINMKNVSLTIWNWSFSFIVLSKFMLKTEAIKFGCTSTRRRDRCIYFNCGGHCTPYIGNKAVLRRKAIIAFDKMVSTTC